MMIPFLKNTILSIFFFTALCLQAQAQENKPMNVVFILADDLGWSDTTLYGTTSFYQTPNIERLAARGLTFNRAYAASPLCSPTRASILTGQTPARNGVTAPQAHLPEVRLKETYPEKSAPGKKVIIPQSVTRLDTSLPTLGKLVKSAGYATAHFGKWHLGLEPYTPLQHGFDLDIPHWQGPGPAGSFVAPWKFKDFKENYPKEHIEDRMAEEAVHWMQKQDRDKPFFMNYWQFSVHAPFDAKETYIDYYRTQVDFENLQHSPTYAAMVHSLDDAVGRLLDEIDRLGIADNTIIIFFSDNGGNMYNGIVESLPNGEKFLTPPTSNTPLKGGKATMYEGGIRVPCVVVWPGLTNPGTTTDALIQSTDFYPTLVEHLGLEVPEDYRIDGVNLTPVLKGEAFKRKPVITYFPHDPGVPDWLPPSVAVNDGDWKLIRLFKNGADFEDEFLLFNLKWDIGETNNLASTYPEKVDELNTYITEHLTDAGTIIPPKNPAFDPSMYDSGSIGKQDGGLRHPTKIQID
ncbi:sulfatase [Leeuwenhoekiella parthenopeia]|uniref:Sulfatase n=1 Tax=Leeuwenhoekiella parthenopeia TaxID=2890320 RepID=A0ABS8GNE4_9FLAO|nr:sulfatase [Leeuwenhoekiella parthenopeia]MCC4211519.1 sulfatase [Leeuwenhoekiella parthenopeia]